MSAEPPQTCHPDRTLPCINNLICDVRYNLCTCADGTVLLGSQCIETTPDDGGDPDFTSKYQFPPFSEIFHQVKKNEIHFLLYLNYLFVLSFVFS